MRCSYVNLSKRVLLKHRHASTVTVYPKTSMRAIPGSSSEFEGVEGNQDVQDALMQQLRVQIENQTLKEEIRDDLKGKVEGIKQISDEVRG